MNRLAPSRRDDAVGFDPVDAAGLQMHVRLGERAVIGIGHRRPFAPEVVIRRQLAAQFLVTDRQKPMQFGEVRRGDVDSA